MLPRLDSNQQPFDSADQLDRQRGAAAILRHGWPDHPDRAEQIIAGPAFRYLADRMLTAQQDGHDVTAMLRRLDPVTLTAAHIPSPSGAVTFAFSRAHTTPGPADLNVSDTEPATLGLPEPDPADPMPGRPAPVEAPAQQPAMHWS